MDNIRSVLNLLQDSSYLTSLDLKDAYLHVPIHLESQQFLRFAVVLEGESLKTISLRKAMALLGTITSSFPAIQWGQLHSRSLQSWILSKWDKHLSSLDKRVMIPWSVKQSLLWWTEPQHLSTGNLWEFPTQYIITTDASSWGWGAHLDSLTAQGQWSSRISNRSSNSRELQAVWEAILAFKIQIWKTHVTIRTDNSTVVAYINHQGGTRSKSLQQQASRILHWAERSLKSIKAVHLKGDTKLPSRLPEQMQSVPGRMESQRPGVSSVDRTLDCSSSGLIRQKEQCEMPDVLLSLSPRRTMGSRCLLDQLEPSQNVHFSASTFDFQSTEQNLSRPGGSNLDCPVLAKKTVVCSATTISYGSSDPSRSRGPVNSGTSGASQSEPSSSFSMEPEWRILKSKGFSNRLSETLLQSRKKVTRQIYSKAWRVYNNWCEANSRDTGHSNSVLEFLQDGFQKGLSSSTLKVQVSALTVFLDRKLAEEEDIIRFFKALRRIRPTIHSRVPSWDLNTVLQGLCEPPFEPLVDSSDKLLTIKTAFLLAITSARRVGELQALSILEPYCVISDDRITLRLDTSFLPKVVSKFHRSQEIFLPSFCNNPSNQKEQKLHCLDVRRCVLEYLQRTKSWRTSNALLVLFAGKFRGKQASKSTIARWIKQAISLSYAQQGKQLTSAVRAHSTRAVSTSWAERAGASVEQICKAATWSSQNTFVRHYRLDVLSSADLTFGRKVLQAVIPP
ncbi:uncharacterized protein [Hyperolius riggenbachi]|uniref:uncharacterized protein n=1 Tax=Hyperolius riggenbachi TaxID=752182 RepID=UPI0035A2B132